MGVEINKKNKLNKGYSNVFYLFIFFYSSFYKSRCFCFGYLSDQLATIARFKYRFAPTASGPRFPNFKSLFRTNEHTETDSICYRLNI